MKTIVEALKELYIAMGGESSSVADFSLNPDVIEQIASLVASGETKELPAVTAEDNGKMLAVVEGAWDKAEAGGGDTKKPIVKANITLSSGTISNVKVFYNDNTNETFTGAEMFEYGYENVSSVTIKEGSTTVISGALVINNVTYTGTPTAFVTVFTQLASASTGLIVKGFQITKTACSNTGGGTISFDT